MTFCRSLREVGIRYRGGLGGLEEGVRQALEGSFWQILSRGQAGVDAPGEGGLVADPEKVADRIARIIFNFSRAEAAAALPEGAIEAIRPPILEFVRRRSPVEAQMFWSPKKHWIQGPESAVDLAELAALQTLLGVDSAVRGVYPGGMLFRLDVEDLEFEFMEMQNEEVVAARETYISGLRRLIDTLRLGKVFALCRVSERAKSAEVLKQWRQQMEENHRALEAYWYESEGCIGAKQEALPSFKELRRLGWKGTIPPEMRRYYLSRLGWLGGAPDRKRVDMVLRNFAGILLHRQIGLLCGANLVDPVRFSFVRPADCAPAELVLGRVDLRFVPRKICSRVSAAAPWATKGFVCGRGNRVIVSFRGWHELAGARCRFTEGWLTLTGHEAAAEVRADFCHKEGGKV